MAAWFLAHILQSSSSRWLTVLTHKCVSISVPAALAASGELVSSLHFLAATSWAGDSSPVSGAHCLSPGPTHFWLWDLRQVFPWDAVSSSVTIG